MFTAQTVYSGTERLFLTILANTSRRATVHRAGRRLDRVPCMCVNPCDFPLLLLLHTLTFSESINLTQNRCVKPCALSASSCCFQHAHSSQTTHMHIFLPVLFVNLSCLACLGDKCLNRGMFSLLIMQAQRLCDRLSDIQKCHVDAWHVNKQDGYILCRLPGR